MPPDSLIVRRLKEYPLVQKLSIDTERQSLAFFLHQTLSLRRLYGSLTSAEQSPSLAMGEVLGRAYQAIVASLAVYFEHQRLRKALWSIVERLLDDIGLNRSDIEK